jgi:hypothetical protein
MTDATNTIAPPDNYEEADDSVYSNAEHTLNDAIAERLRAGPFYASHAAWEFHGVVWFDPVAALWYERVKRYGVVVAHYTGADVIDVIRQANDNHGYK